MAIFQTNTILLKDIIHIFIYHLIPFWDFFPLVGLKGFVSGFVFPGISKGFVGGLSFLIFSEIGLVRISLFRYIFLHSVNGDVV